MCNKWTIENSTVATDLGLTLEGVLQLRHSGEFPVGHGDGTGNANRVNLNYASWPEQ